MLADTNEDVLSYLAQFYNLPAPPGSRDVHLQSASLYIENAIKAHARSRSGVSPRHAAPAAGP